MNDSPSYTNPKVLDLACRELALERHLALERAINAEADRDAYRLVAQEAIAQLAKTTRDLEMAHRTIGTLRQSQRERNAA